MDTIAQQFACRECGDVSWEREEHHDQPMAPLCFCGSGLFLDECHWHAGKSASDNEVSEENQS